MNTHTHKIQNIEEKGNTDLYRCFLLEKAPATTPILRQNQRKTAQIFNQYYFDASIGEWANVSIGEWAGDAKLAALCIVTAFVVASISVILLD